MKPIDHTPKILACVAPDGDYVTENGIYRNTRAAWDRSNDMGSRWFFFPIHVVCTPGLIVADVPHGMPREWVGRKLSTLRAAIASDEEHACEYINGESPFGIYP